MKKLSLFIFAFIFGSVLTSNATIVRPNTAGIEDLEWLEFGFTLGMPRYIVDTYILNTKPYDGYRYATREETALLLDSYYESKLTDVDDGWYEETKFAADLFLKDFGHTSISDYNNTIHVTSFDSEQFNSKFHEEATFMYGADTLTIEGAETLLGHVALHSFHDELRLGWFYEGHGTDQTFKEPATHLVNPGKYFKISSLLVRETKPVPEPSTILLFGAGLASLVGFRSRRKKN